MRFLHARRPAPATVIALIALFVAIGGPAEAARLINGKLIRKGTVSSKQVKDRSLTTRDLSRSTYDTLRAIPDGSVGAAQLAAGAVGPAALALNGVSGSNVADGTIGTPDLADNAVTTEKILANTIRGGDIGSGAVGASEIATGSVRGSEVQDGSLDGVDVAEFRGSFPHDVPELAKGECHSFEQPITPTRTDVTVSATDDVVLISPEAGRWSGDLTLTAVPQTATSILVSACNVGSATPVDPASDVSFRYLAIDG